MQNNLLRVIVLTQNDRFFIPRNIHKASRVCQILEVVQINCKSSLDQKLGDYFKWFGFLQCAKMGIKTCGREALKYLDRMSGYRLAHGFCSVKDVARAMNVPFRVIENVNDESFVRHVRELGPDLAISYSAPQIIKEELLHVPREGIINVHSSLLPNYRGVLPSFWYLYHEEKTGGVTVHYMGSKLDDGAIIEQESMDISACRTMFELLKKTKELGGELMVKAIDDIARGSVDLRPNEANKGSYFTWPTTKEAKEFLARGYRLI